MDEIYVWGNYNPESSRTYQSIHVTHSYHHPHLSRFPITNTFLCTRFAFLSGLYCRSNEMFLKT